MTGYVVLCPNPYRDIGFKFTLRAAELLKKEGIPVVLSPVFDWDGKVLLPENVEVLPLEQAAECARLVVSFGGDGTILHTARGLLRTSVPILGVNLGTKGFLAELEPNELQLLLKAARGDFVPVPRMMLDVSLFRDGKEIFTDSALNDAVVSGIAHAVRIAALGDGQVITEFSGDGMIVATPTGSTAYSMSAGGPLVEPTAENMILTPICPHALAARSFVLAPDRQVKLYPKDLRGKRAVLSVDGGEPIDLCQGDEIHISKSQYVTMLAKVSSKSFYDIAFEKLSERK